MVFKNSKNPTVFFFSFFSLLFEKTTLFLCENLFLSNETKGGGGGGGGC